MQTIKQMRASRPDVAIVAISGGLSLGQWTKVDVLDIAGKLGADITLEKPFQLSELTAAVDASLASKQCASVAARA